jgi:hypothetical protein
MVRNGSPSLRTIRNKEEMPWRIDGIEASETHIVTEEV